MQCCVRQNSLLISSMITNELLGRSRIFHSCIFSPYMYLSVSDMDIDRFTITKLNIYAKCLDAFVFR